MHKPRDSVKKKKAGLWLEKEEPGSVWTSFWLLKCLVFVEIQIPGLLQNVKKSELHLEASTP